MNIEVGRLEKALSEGHQSFFGCLRKGADDVSLAPSELSQLYSWRNGQGDGAEFLRQYRFVSIEEVEVIKGSNLPSSFLQRVALWVFSRRLVRSWPVLVDAFGGGFYFDSRTKTVFLAEEGESHHELGDVGRFIGFWLILAAKTNESMDDEKLAEVQYRLIQD